VELDASTLLSKIAASSRRKGLYASHLTTAALEVILSALVPVKAGPESKENNPHEGRVKEMEK